MKIEMGESLIYSWLRHIHNCQIVQLNWKPSPKWAEKPTNELQCLMEDATRLFEEQGLGRLFGKTQTVQQVFKQAECDALGIAFNSNDPTFYAVDVAYHQSGLLYQSTKETARKVIAKCLRNAMCVYRYFSQKSGEIIFASPKVNLSAERYLKESLPPLNELLRRYEFNFCVKIIMNDDFKNEIVTPIQSFSDIVSDTSELFLRSYQLLRLVEE